MANDPVFVLDTNVFLEAALRYYAFDLAPAFWDKLVQHATDGRIESVDWVQRELSRRKDELATWAAGPFAHAFTTTADQDVVDAYRDVMIWASSQNQFLAGAISDFASGADGWLVAYAKAKGRIVVTQEVGRPDARRKVPIPNVCQAFGLPCVDTFTMLRRLQVQLG